MDNEINVAKIGKNFSFWGLARFALPVMAMELLRAAFKTLDDGLFVSRFVGKNALASISIVFPFIMCVFGLSFMIAVGTSAVCSTKMGAGYKQEANRDFTTIVVISFFTGCIFSILFFLLEEPILRLLGATDLLMDDCKKYIEILFITMPISMMGPVLDTMYPAAGKPVMGLISSFTSGVANIVFNFIFIVLMGIGIRGAALATALGDVSIFIIGVVFYLGKKHDVSFSGLTKKWLPLFGKVCKIGVAEYVTSLSMSITAYAANLTMLSVIGENGVSAYAIMGNINYLFISAALGFINAVAPVLSYNLGKRDAAMLRKQVRNGMIFLSVFGFVMFAVCLIFAKPLISIYVPQGSDIEFSDMIHKGLMIAATNIPFAMPTIFITGMFLALSNPKTSTALSLLHNFVFNLAAILILPRLFGLIGVWVALPAGELISLVAAVILFYRYGNKYGYIKSGKTSTLDTVGYNI